MENDRLSQYLAALEREDCYRVDTVLKESPHEITQRVFFVGANGAEQGPFIRKLIDRDSGMGVAYERIFEAQEAGRRFKHIPHIHECYHDESSLVVVMEFVQGETLQDVVYQRDPSLQLAREVFPLVCDAVSELHEAFDPPLIHRDLKPSNVMLTGDAFAIIDFGIARVYRQGADADTVKFGTRAFAPPEQFGFGQTSVQSDVYALGMLLYYCLTEKIPTPQIRDAGFRVEGVPSRLRPVLMRATSLDASERHRSAEELKQAFIEAANQKDLTGESADGPSDGIAIPSRYDKQSAPSQRRSRKAVAIVAAIVFAIVIAAALAFATGVLERPAQTNGQAELHESSNATNGASASASASKRSESSQAETDGQATEATASSRSAQQGQAESAAPDAQQDANAAAASAATDGMQASAPLRNDFNPATNMTTTIAGVTFQIPRCFGQPTVSEQGAAYYYAERGTASAMIMTAENAMDTPADEYRSAEGRTKLMDGFLVGLVSSNVELFSEVTQGIDCTLAGYPARIVTFRGTVKELPMTSKVVYFYNPDLNAIGSIDFGQTDNTQFNYAEDFAKTLASAVPADSKASAS